MRDKQTADDGIVVRLAPLASTMTSRDEKSLFLHAADLPREARRAFLDAHAPDATTRARVEALLRHHDVFATRTGDRVPVRDSTSGESDVPGPGDRIGRYTVVSEIGRGGMGVVYLAADEQLERRVALKVMPGAALGVERVVHLLRHEARMAAALRHPAVVPVFEAGVVDGRHVIVSEFVDGMTLAEEFARVRQDAATLASKPWRIKLVESIASVADALEACRRVSIIHRDVKPSNVLIDPEHGARLSDFGVAIRVENAATATRVEDGAGTLAYMSPEQLDQSEAVVDHRSDIYSLGVVLFEGLAGRRPFEGLDARHLADAARAGAAPPPHRFVGGIDRDLETIVMKAIERVPDHRYPTAGQLAADLRAWLAGESPLASRPSRWRRFQRRWLRTRQQRTLSVVGSLACALAALAGWQILVLYQSQFVELRVEAPSGSTLHLNTFDQATGEIRGDATTATRGVGTSIQLEPGQYRLTVTTAEGSFAEFHVLVREGDRGECITTIAHAAAAPTTVRPMSARTTLSGILASPSPHPEMIEIPGGEQRLRALGRSDEAAVDVRLASFWIDRCEVSNAEYRAFVDATGAPPPRSWFSSRADGSPTFAAGLDRHPVTGVNVDEAEAYARWRGKRLPTRAEWERAMERVTSVSRGADGHAPTRPAPGEELLKLRAATTAAELSDAFARYAVAVDSPDHSAPHADLLHMSGNVRELTASVQLDSHAVIVKGNAFWDFPTAEPVGASGLAPLDSCAIDHGFRCARSVVPNQLFSSTSHSSHVRGDVQ